jgi:TolB protein
MFLKIGEKDNYEIYSMNMDGTGQRNITNTPGVQWVYCAYKDKLYYVCDKDGWVNRRR